MTKIHLKTVIENASLNQTRDKFSIVFDQWQFSSYYKGMTDTIKRISKLEEQVSELLGLCQRLSEDNIELRSQLQRLTSERSTLIEQKEKVRVQVESMITRLRSMEKA